MSRFKEGEHVICTFTNREDRRITHLTEGKIYEVIMIMGDEFVVLSDNGSYDYYSDKLFISKGEFRNNIIDNILD